VSGPGTVGSPIASAVDTTASFSASGTYVLSLTAERGALSTSDQVTITVGWKRRGRDEQQHQGLGGSDDAEESASGSMTDSSASSWF